VVSLAYAVLTVADSCLSQDDKPGEDMSPPFLLVREPDSTRATSRVTNGGREFWLDWTDGCTRLRGPGSDGVQRGTPNASSFTQDGKGFHHALAVSSLAMKWERPVCRTPQVRCARGTLSDIYYVIAVSCVRCEHRFQLTTLRTDRSWTTRHGLARWRSCSRPPTAETPLAVH